MSGGSKIETDGETFGLGDLWEAELGKTAMPTITARANGAEANFEVKA